MKKPDYYHHLAKKRGYKSRAAFKLIQINERFYIIKRGYTVLDLGASPGGWSQVALELVGDSGKVIAVDIKPIKIRGVAFIRADVFSEDIIEKIREIADTVDVVISDMSPNISGIHSVDHARSIDLAQRAFFIAEQVLRVGGNFVTKAFQGDLLKNFVKELQKNFELVKVHKPKASTPRSSETYIICKRFKGAQINA